MRVYGARFASRTDKVGDRVKLHLLPDIVFIGSLERRICAGEKQCIGIGVRIMFWNGSVRGAGVACLAGPPLESSKAG